MPGPKGLFARLPIRLKLFFGYIAAFLLVFALGNLLLYALIRKDLEDKINNELASSTQAILTLVRSSAGMAIKNYLRAVAEKNLDIARHYQMLQQAGVLSEKEAKAKALEILLSQTIAQTGYLYCVDSKGVIQGHPKQGPGTDLSQYDFIKKQIRLKQGYLEYDWANPGDDDTRPKALYMAYFEPWDWIISATSYRGEFTDLIDVRDFRDTILSIRFGQTGYPYIMDSKGLLIVHPSFEGVNISESVDSQGRKFIKEICDRKNGSIIYPWKNPQDPEPREKLVYFNYIPELDWIVASSSYLEEFYKPLATVRYAITAMAAAMFVLMFPVAWWIGSFIIRPLTPLIAGLRAGAEGDLSQRADTDQGGEIGQLASYYNHFMDRLVESQLLLEESREQYRNIFENAVEGIYRSTPEYRLLQVNPAMASIFGYDSPDEMLDQAGKTRQKLYADDLERDAFLQRLHRDKIVMGFEARFLRKDGSMFWGEENARAVLDDQGIIQSVEGIIQDVTEQREAREALQRAKEEAEEASRVKSDFLSMVSHEMRTPLTSVVGFSKFVSKRLAGIIKPNLDLSAPKVDKAIEQIQTNLDIMAREGKRLGRLIDDVLDLSSMEAGKMVLNLEPVAMSEIVQRTLASLQGLVQEKELHTSVSLEPDLPPVKGDSDRLQQLLTNLVANSVKFMEAGSITIKGVRKQDEVLISVIDTGPGIPEEYLGKIFSRFFQIGEVLTDKPQGTGLGLAICREIVHLHGGRIWVESKLGQGSIFYFTLPVA